MIYQENPVRSAPKTGLIDKWELLKDTEHSFQ